MSQAFASAANLLLQNAHTNHFLKFKLRKGETDWDKAITFVVTPFLESMYFHY